MQKRLLKERLWGHVKLIISGPTTRLPVAPLLKDLQSIFFSFLDLWSTVQQAKFTQAFYLELQSGSLQHFLHSSKYISLFQIDFFSPYIFFHPKFELHGSLSYSDQEFSTKGRYD